MNSSLWPTAREIIRARAQPIVGGVLGWAPFVLSRLTVGASYWSGAAFGQALLRRRGPACPGRARRPVPASGRDRRRPLYRDPQPGAARRPRVRRSFPSCRPPGSLRTATREARAGDRLRGRDPERRRVLFLPRARQVPGPAAAPRSCPPLSDPLGGRVPGGAAQAEAGRLPDRPEPGAPVARRGRRQAWRSSRSACPGREVRRKSTHANSVIEIRREGPVHEGTARDRCDRRPGRPGRSARRGSTPGSYQGQKGRIEDSYIVVFNRGREASSLASELAGVHSGELEHVYRHCPQGAAYDMTAAQAEAVARDPWVAAVEEDFDSPSSATRPTRVLGPRPRRPAQPALNGDYHWDSTAPACASM